MTTDPHDAINEAHHQIAGMMALIGSEGELQPMRGADLYFLLKSVDDRLRVALNQLEAEVSRR